MLATHCSKALHRDIILSENCSYSLPFASLNLENWEVHFTTCLLYAMHVYAKGRYFRHLLSG